MICKALLVIILISAFNYFGTSACLDPLLPYSYGSSCFADCPWNSTIVTYLYLNSCVTSIISFITRLPKSKLLFR